jgi:hypothetical protein
MTTRAWRIAAVLGALGCAVVLYLALRPEPEMAPAKSELLRQAEAALRRAGCFAAVVVDSAAAWDSGQGGPTVARCEAPESIMPTCATLAKVIVESGAARGQNFATMVTGGGRVHCYVLYDSSGKPIGDFLADAADAGSE